MQNARAIVDGTCLTKCHFAVSVISVWCLCSVENDDLRLNMDEYQWSSDVKYT